MTATCDACDVRITGDSYSAYDVNGDVTVTICEDCARVDWYARER